MAFLGRILDHRGDAGAELGGEPVTFGARGHLAVMLVDRDGDLPLQRGEPHQRVDQRRHPGIGPVQPAHQHVERRAVARADHREQRQGRHIRLVRRRHRSFDRFDPAPARGVQEAAAQEHAAQFDHPFGILRCPDPLVRETSQPLRPIGFGYRVDLGRDDLPRRARRADQRAVEIECVQPAGKIDRRGDRVLGRQVGAGQRVAPSRYIVDPQC